MITGTRMVAVEDVQVLGAPCLACDWCTWTILAAVHLAYRILQVLTHRPVCMLGLSFTVEEAITINRSLEKKVPKTHSAVMLYNVKAPWNSYSSISIGFLLPTSSVFVP